MGNKLARERQNVDERFTRPQGLYPLSKDVDLKKLRKLIRESKLAPCYVGSEEGGAGLEECPICFMFYPSLNRSRCCTKAICTECLIQIVPPHSARSAQCPFCKTSNYGVQYHGSKSEEEKQKEQIEEQRVIEAKIRMQQKELHDEQERMLRGQDVDLITEEIEQTAVISRSITDLPSTPLSSPNEEVTPSQDSSSGLLRQSNARQNRDDGFDLDLEDIMVREAIRLSIEERDGALRPVPSEEHTCSRPSTSESQFPLSGFPPREESYSSAGLACATAAPDFTSDPRSNETVGSRNSTSSEGEARQSTGRTVRENWIEVSPQSGRALSRDDSTEGAVDYGSAVAEAGTSCASSTVHSVSNAAVCSPPPLPCLDNANDQSLAVSLAEARARSSSRGS